MSFSQDVKTEIMEHLPQARHCQIAALAGIYMLCGFVNRDKGNVLCFHTENINAARMGFTLLKKTFNIDFGLSVRKGKAYSYDIRLEKNGSQNVREALKLDEAGGRVSELLIERACCRKAFITGAFVTAGSMTDPERSYHFEIVCPDKDKADEILAAIRSFDIEARVIQRKRNFVVYVKDGDGIVDMLNIMEANTALLNMENTRVLKDMRNRVNRNVNCETANIKKTAQASYKQISDIEFLMEKGAFEGLDENLKQTAVFRLENKEASLAELGEMFNPPVGKSGINHRLRKISEIAEKLGKENRV
ncbi:MAG: DNA-binding protein WhiA [Lachnospiraceae bacterium]|nr:DNA-binding protein WhiA [Lachnospiraceae bacterium]